MPIKEKNKIKRPCPSIEKTMRTTHPKERARVISYEVKAYLNFKALEKLPFEELQ